MINSTFVIAEIGTSHEGDFNKAKKLIDACKESGADAVKFQWVYADEILHPKTGFVKLPTGNISLYERFKTLEVPKSFFKDCLEYAHKKGLKFVCSPFGLQSLEELLEIKPDYLKVASPELNHFPLLKKIAEYRKLQIQKKQQPIPLILSSGVSKEEDIFNALNIVGRENVYLLHCVTSYPAPETDYNLKVLKTLKEKFNVKVGVSDHSSTPLLVPVLSISQGGCMIEKHITLSNETSGLDDPVALNPENFGFMCHFVHQSDAVMRHYGDEKGEKEIIRQLELNEDSKKIKKILGNGIKVLAESEKANYGRTNRSLHYMKDLKKGHKIQKGDIEILRTEKVLSPGISPSFYDEVLGKELLNDVENGSGVQKENFFELASSS